MKSVLVLASALCLSGMNLMPGVVLAQFMIHNPANPDQTPRYLTSSFIEPRASAHHYRTLPRFLQTGGGNLPDIVANDNECATLGGLQFICNLFAQAGPPENVVNINISIICDYGTVQFDFRRATNCQCSALITPSDPSKITKVCPCFPCAVGFGSSAVSYDCTKYVVPTNGTSAPTVPPSAAPSLSEGGGFGSNGSSSTNSPFTSGSGSSMAPSPSSSVSSTGRRRHYHDRFLQAGGGVSTAAPSPMGSSMTMAPSMSTSTMMNETTNSTNSSNTTYDPFIFGDCSSIDCSANCNGTCNIGCGAGGAGPECPFCAGAAGAPTPAPTGANAHVGSITHSGAAAATTTAAVPTTTLSTLLGLGVAAAMMMAPLLAL